ncbi:MAG: hemerythrin domain-containing protein [Candidatus Rokubacteria bacterium]|nr:hemerythrin domain-containing protein [Candidatus Rokubacteria bacterium]
MPLPTQILIEEHRVILHALDTLARGADHLRAGGALPDAWWEELVEWFRAFADRNHHAKEEAALFPALVKHGVPQEGGPVGVMLEEHRQGRALIVAMAAGDPLQRADKARQYVILLRQHIDKENDILFPMADEALDDGAKRAVGRQFEAIKAEQGKTASMAWAEGVVSRLAAALG